ncbi:MAG: amino acid ABC transporter permease [Desulfovibrionaceae bacterium]|nr:amino acid ABC transporter permease [Desulfovibrionaceae bacterium]
MSYIPGISPARSWRHLKPLDIILALCGLAFVLWFLIRAAAVTQHHWDWAALTPYLFSHDAAGHWQAGALPRGLLTTLRVGAWSMLLALFSGGLVGILSAHQRGFAALPAVIYVNALRNTPPLVLLFLVFFFAGSFFNDALLRVSAMARALPPAAQGLFSALLAPPDQLDRMVAAVLTLGLYEGAYVAEIVRAGLESVPKSQWEASAGQGMSPWQQYRHVILPQAARLMTPPLVSQTISTFKETTLASIISLPELTFQSLEIMAVTRMTFELWLTTAALYLIISYAWAGLGHRLERRRRWQPLE